MYGQISTLAFVGIEARPVDVQVRLSGGQFHFAIVGLPDKAVAESRERVRNALHALGLGLPGKHITVNLSPADLPKEGSHFDLAIALALMVAMGALSSDAVADFAAVGELALDGAIRPVPGVLPAAIGANALGKGLICPGANGSEAAWAGEDVRILAAPHLLSLMNHFKGLQTLRQPEPHLESRGGVVPDLRDIKGQDSAKRALEVAAAGGHNLLMVGPPGSGNPCWRRDCRRCCHRCQPKKCCRCPWFHHWRANWQAGGWCGIGRSGRRITQRRWRRWLAGGSRPRPGEISLAHNGVLFLDELPEFNAGALDALRQPLETGEAVIARANHRIAYPCRFQLVAAMNPASAAAVGLGRRASAAPVAPRTIRRGCRGRCWTGWIFISRCLPFPPRTWCCRRREKAVRTCVPGFWRRANGRRARYQALGVKGVLINAHASGEVLDAVAMPDADGMNLMQRAAETLGLSARGFHRVLRVARTLADLDAVDQVRRIHIAEALSYRGESLRQRQAA